MTKKTDEEDKEYLTLQLKLEEVEEDRAYFIERGKNVAAMFHGAAQALLTVGVIAPIVGLLLKGSIGDSSLDWISGVITVWALVTGFLYYESNDALRMAYRR